MAMADDKVLIVSYSPTLGSDSAGAPTPTQVISVTGEYTRTQPADSAPICFRKEGGGEIYYDDGYWYISDRLKQQVAWVAAGEFVRPVVVPRNGWQGKGEGFLFASYEDLPIIVEFRQLPPVSPKASMISMPELKCSCFAPVYEKAKDKLPQHHRQSLEGFEAKAIERKESFQATASDQFENAKGLHAQHWPVIKDQALKHSATAKEKYNEYHPIVKEKAKEGYTKCYDFWTHPDTVDKMKTGGNTCFDGIKCVGATCWSLTASLAESVCGIKQQEQAPRPQLPVSESDQAMDDYVKLDSTTPVLVETPMLPPVPLPPGVDATLVNMSVEPTTLPPSRGVTL